MALLQDPEHQEAWCEKESRRNGFIKKTKAQDHGSIRGHANMEGGNFLEVSLRQRQIVTGGGKSLSLSQA